MAARVGQLTDSRWDAVDASAAELRRIERDLHDGAQARLVALGMNIGFAEQMVRDNPDLALTLLAEARASSGQALSELRALVRGIHPPVLAERGLDGAVRALALSLPLPVELHIDLPGRPSAPVESAAYFAIAEALANVVKHSGANRAWVQLEYDHGRLIAIVGDNGAGGAHPRAGGGLAGHRAAAGRLRRYGRGDQPGRRADSGDDGAAVRVVLGEDLTLLRDGLIRLLTAYGMEVVAAVDSGPGLLRALVTQRPDVAVVDVRLPPTFTDEGLRAAIQARAQLPGLPVLVLSQHVEQLYAKELLAAGTGGLGYLLKDRVSDVRRFIEAVRTVAGGGTAMDPDVVSQLLARHDRAERLSPAHLAGTRGTRADG